MTNYTFDSRTAYRAPTYISLFFFFTMRLLYLLSIWTFYFTIYFTYYLFELVSPMNVLYFDDTKLIWQKFNFQTKDGKYSYPINPGGCLYERNASNAAHRKTMCNINVMEYSAWVHKQQWIHLSLTLLLRYVCIIITNRPMEMIIGFSRSSILSWFLCGLLEILNG